MRRTIGLVALATFGVFLGAPAVAGAASDTTRPTLRLPANASFVTGSTIGPMAPDPQTGTPLATGGIHLRASWEASDASGICGYSTQVVYAGFPPDPWSPWSMRRSVSATVTDYDSQQGAGSEKFLGYSVRARDCAGNINRRFVGFRPGVFQEDGRSYGYFGVTTSYTRRWAGTTCSCWSGAAARKTTVRGAGAQFTTDYPEGHPVAMVMERAPDRGRAQILVDGTYRTTIDTYAAAPTHRSVVWTGRLSAGRHTVTVVNLATAGRARVDVDAFLVSGLGA